MSANVETISREKSFKLVAILRPAAAAPESGRDGRMEVSYLETLGLIERLNVRLLDVVRDELERHGIRTINNVQALMLFNLGDEQLSAGQLRSRGCYLGSNVTHTLKKLVALGFLVHEKSESDHRLILVRLTKEGMRVRDILRNRFEDHLKSLEPVASVGTSELAEANTSLSRLEHFWRDRVRDGL